MMNTLAGMGLAGSAVLALWLLASRVLKDRMPARWHYRVLKISLFFFLIPVGQLLALAGGPCAPCGRLPGPSPRRRRFRRRPGSPWRRCPESPRREQPRRQVPSRFPRGRPLPCRRRP